MRFPEFPFTDFCLLAMVLVMLGGFSFLEILTLTVKKELDERKVIPLRKATSYSILGAIATLIVGAFAESSRLPYADIAASALPLGFLVTWGVFQQRGTSVTKFESLEAEANQYYLTLIEKTAKLGVQDDVFLLDKLYRECLIGLVENPPWWAFTAALKLGQSQPLLMGDSLTNLFGNLALTREKFDQLLDQLVKEKRWRIQEGYLLPSAKR